jgi:hypothetical protein
VLYLRTVCKGLGQTVEQFYSNLVLTNHLTGSLPGTELLLTTDEMKFTFFNGMPSAWLEKFKSTGKSIHNEPTSEVLAYMHNREGESNLKQMKQMLLNSIKSTLAATMHKRAKVTLETDLPV